MRIRRSGWVHLLAGVVTSVLVVGSIGVAAGTTNGEANGSAACGSGPRDGLSGNVCARSGDLLDVTLGELRPTQPVLGYDEIYYKLGRYRAADDKKDGGINKRFDDWCETNGQQEAASAQPDARLDDPTSFACKIPVGEETPESMAAMKTAVIGPNGTPYLTDGHHTLTAFQESPDGGAGMHLRVRVTANLSELSTPEFWREMQARKFVWLRDENNQPVTVDQLPQSLGLANFGNDAYRGLVYFTRDIGYAVPDGDDGAGSAPEFLEFYWGTWLRDSYDLADQDLTDHATYLDLIKQASQDMAALDGSAVVAEGKTAGELGKLPEWNDGDPDTKGEFADLSKPISDPEPGKLAYALDYKTNP